MARKNPLTEIAVRTLPPANMRYPTVGDWYPRDDVMQFDIASMGDIRPVACVLIHEIIEALKCQQDGVTAEQVDKWDLAHLDAEEPGDLSGCPYRRQHRYASKIELMVARYLHLKLDDYEKLVERAFAQAERVFKNKKSK